MSESGSGSLPVLLVPANLTKQLKVSLDLAGWRDKAKLIARPSQSIETSSLQQQQGQDRNLDLSRYLTMALLPVEPFLHLPCRRSSDSNSESLLSLQDFIVSLERMQENHLVDQLRAMVPDQTIQSTVFLKWLDASAFATPRHLLALTPLEKLREGLTQFLTPYLSSFLDHSQQKQQAQPSLASDIGATSASDLLQTLISSIPQKWEHYSDFTLLPPGAFQASPWPQILQYLITLDQKDDNHNPDKKQGGILDRLETLVQEALQSKHIARKAIIPVQDVLRRPQIRPLTGDWGLHNRYKSWVEEPDLVLLEHQQIGQESLHPPTPEQQRSLSSTSTTSSTEGSSSLINMDQDLVAPTAENFKGAYWAETCQNQVWYRWAPMFTMFSAGNITEKERVANSRPIFDAKDKVVVDLYAGIGYFTLVYLVHAGARTVHACEWNPWSVEGLKQGADRNGISWSSYHKSPVVAGDAAAEGGVGQSMTMTTIFQQSIATRTVQKKKKKAVVPAHDTTSTTTTAPTEGLLGNLVIYSGDNAQWIDSFENQAHHVNLGLIPSAEPGWVLGVRALCPDQGGYLHVHHNIRVGEEEAFKTYLVKSLQDLFKTWKSPVLSESGEGSLAQENGWTVEIRHLENVKSFAPLVFHYVVDVECRPPNWSPSA
ncbi:tRNA wybutosine-synthesizing protein 2 [Entomortierella parvispora]|uniref:tRNA(Phe) (4-demethylwyosine(37)-C(7)) aminocarboxypropyltransferase n=1 Tax=Entomortierella parvispora TaxID=205924 RepID=A0A9P3LRS8_9FUNG|nr:tRNA wybutosine-synthesizing protein 2 [Entomortierella parvispora]